MSEQGTTEDIEYLPLGKYLVKEVISSEGYLLDTKEYDIDNKIVRFIGSCRNVDFRNVGENKGIYIPRLDDKNFIALKTLVERTNAKIILSSYWRYYFDKNLMPNNNGLHNHGKDLTLKLRKHNLSLKDKTSTDLTRFQKRGDIIKEYLHTHEDIDNFVILDDDNIMKEFTDTNLIQTKPEYGLTMSDVKKAENILNKTKVKKL